jgi:sugar transferase EpsL
VITRFSSLRDLGKRVLDVLISTVLIMVFAPLLVLTAIYVRVFLGKPVLFKQVRAGLKGRPFVIYKFRTMAVVTAFPRDERSRQSPPGLFLRRLGLDELPQLLNVLKGDMSLVGPRPLLTDYLALYSPEQKRRLEVRPGITGLAQVNGRNSLSWEEKFSLDVEYLESRTFCLDLRILMQTFRVLFGQDVTLSLDQTEVMPFTGNSGTSPGI